MIRTKDSLIVDILDAVPQAHGERTHEDVQVEEERRPRGRLMLWHRRDDRNVDLRVRCVPQRVESRRKWSVFKVEYLLMQAMTDEGVMIKYVEHFDHANGEYYDA